MHMYKRKKSWKKAQQIEMELAISRGTEVMVLFFLLICSFCFN